MPISTDGGRTAAPSSPTRYCRTLSTLHSFVAIFSRLVDYPYQFSDVDLLLESTAPQSIVAKNSRQQNVFDQLDSRARADTVEQLKDLLYAFRLVQFLCDPLQTVASALHEKFDFKFILKLINENGGCGELNLVEQLPNVRGFFELSREERIQFLVALAGLQIEVNSEAFSRQVAEKCMPEYLRSEYYGPTLKREIFWAIIDFRGSLRLYTEPKKTLKMLQQEGRSNDGKELQLIGTGSNALALLIHKLSQDLAEISQRIRVVDENRKICSICHSETLPEELADEENDEMNECGVCGNFQHNKCFQNLDIDMNFEEEEEENENEETLNSRESLPESQVPSKISSIERIDNSETLDNQEDEEMKIHNSEFSSSSQGEEDLVNKKCLVCLHKSTLVDLKVLLEWFEDRQNEVAREESQLLRKLKKQSQTLQLMYQKFIVSREKYDEEILKFEQAKTTADFDNSSLKILTDQLTTLQKIMQSNEKNLVNYANSIEYENLENFEDFSLKFDSDQTTASERKIELMMKRFEKFENSTDFHDTIEILHKISASRSRKNSSNNSNCLVASSMNLDYHFCQYFPEITQLYPNTGDGNFESSALQNRDYLNKLDTDASEMHTINDYFILDSTVSKAGAGIENSDENSQGFGRNETEEKNHFLNMIHTRNSLKRGMISNESKMNSEYFPWSSENSDGENEEEEEDDEDLQMSNQQKFFSATANEDTSNSNHYSDSNTSNAQLQMQQQNEGAVLQKRKRGRPKGSKSKSKLKLDETSSNGNNPAANSQRLLRGQATKSLAASNESVLSSTNVGGESSFAATMTRLYGSSSSMKKQVAPRKQVRSFKYNDVNAYRFMEEMEEENLGVSNNNEFFSAGYSANSGGSGVVSGITGRNGSSTGNFLNNMFIGSQNLLKPGGINCTNNNNTWMLKNNFSQFHDDEEFYKKIEENLQREFIDIFEKNDEIADRESVAKTNLVDKPSPKTPVRKRTSMTRQRRNQIVESSSEEEEELDGKEEIGDSEGSKLRKSSEQDAVSLSSSSSEEIQDILDSFFDTGAATYQHAEASILAPVDSDDSSQSTSLSQLSEYQLDENVVCQKRKHEGFSPHGDFEERNKRFKDLSDITTGENVEPLQNNNHENQEETSLNERTSTNLFDDSNFKLTDFDFIELY